MKFLRLSLSFLLSLACAVPTLAGGSADLDTAYAAIHAEAVRIAGEPGDIPPRAEALFRIYLDSGKNYRFPLVAMHGALWANRFFEVTGPVGKAVSYRYAFSPDERSHREELLEAFSTRFKAANRQVFIDTYTNYYFSKAYGDAPGASSYVEPELLAKLREVHHANSGIVRLTEAEKRVIFETALLFEQEKSVGPRVKEAVADFDCPILRALVLKPFVRFKYFPKTKYFRFHDFSDQRERVRSAMEAYDLGVKAGWKKVELTLADYQGHAATAALR